MNINYIENHLNASLITECKKRITRARAELSCACPFMDTLLFETTNDPFFLHHQLLLNYIINPLYWNTIGEICICIWLM